VSGVVPADHKVVCYIKVGTRWWIKPFQHLPLTVIEANSTWVCDVTTGGSDETATELVAFLVTNGHQPVIALGTSNIPISVNGKDVLAEAGAKR
jgi:hypothetical protein